jgi:hypothetical protein
LGNAERRVARARAFYGAGVDYEECDATDIEGRVHCRFVLPLTHFILSFIPIIRYIYF